jgi:hypothetical protein
MIRSWARTLTLKALQRPGPCGRATHDAKVVDIGRFALAATILRGRPMDTVLAEAEALHDVEQHVLRSYPIR